MRLPSLALKALLVGVGALSLASTAHAQSTDSALAETLFQDGKALMEAGDYAKGCPKLAASNRIDPSTGTLLALAICHDGEGKTATAWAEFTDAATAAKKDGRTDREKMARGRVAALEPLLSRITIVVSAGSNVPGLEVKLDGTLVDKAAWDSPVPVDPGSHVLEASAPGKKRWTQSTMIAPKADRKTVTVVLDDEGAAPSGPFRGEPFSTTTAAIPPAEIAPAEARYWTARRMLGVATGVTGVAAMAAGGLVGLVAKSRDDTASTEAGAARHDDSASAVRQGNVATAIFGVGVALAAVGAVVWLTAPSGQAVAVSSNGSALFVRGSF